MTQGKLVPDQIVIDLILERLNLPDAQSGYILDGFPRTLEQAERLGDEEDVDLVLNIDVPFDLLIERLTGRRSCPKCGSVFHIKYNPPKLDEICDKCSSKLIQRTDDKEEVIRNRLETYNQQTKPLINFYKQKNKLKDIPGSGKIDDVFQNISVILNN
jgi:adenylate kinase